MKRGIIMAAALLLIGATQAGDERHVARTLREYIALAPMVRPTRRRTDGTTQARPGLLTTRSTWSTRCHSPERTSAGAPSARARQVEERPMRVAPHLDLPLDGADRSGLLHGMSRTPSGSQRRSQTCAGRCACGSGAASGTATPRQAKRSCRRSSRWRCGASGALTHRRDDDEGPVLTHEAKEVSVHLERAQRRDEQRQGSGRGPPASRWTRPRCCRAGYTRHPPHGGRSRRTTPRGPRPAS